MSGWVRSLSLSNDFELLIIVVEQTVYHPIPCL